MNKHRVFTGNVNICITFSPVKNFPVHHGKIIYSNIITGIYMNTFIKMKKKINYFPILS